MAGVVEALMGGLGSALTGGATGLIGTAISSFIDFKKQKEQFRHKEKIHQLELQMMEKEAELAIKRTHAEADAQIQVTEAVTEQKIAMGELEGWVESQRQGNKALLTEKDKKPQWLIGVMGIVDVLRACIRPVLTIVGTIMLFVIYFKVDGLIGGMNIAFDSTQLYDLYKYLIYSFVYLTFTMVFWWFGTRSKVQAPKMEKI